MEGCNPTGSYKDRGSATLVSHLTARGVRSAVEDSSGNAGASFAAYAARAGMQARVFVPASALAAKRDQIKNYGAQLVVVEGARSAASLAVQAEVQQGAVYASHAYSPYWLPGVATLAYEIWEDLGVAPGALIAPVGHGGLMAALLHGFLSLRLSGAADHVPFLLGVQAANCAPGGARLPTECNESRRD